MYVLGEYTNPKNMLVSGSQDPWGPQFDPELVAKASKMVARATTLNDPGPDYMEWELFDENGNSLGIRRRSGY